VFDVEREAVEKFEASWTELLVSVQAELDTQRSWRTRKPCSTGTTVGSVTTVGIGELRQQASELVRRVERGEEITITVAGRPTARLVPASTRVWRSWTEIEDLFSGLAETGWEQDRNRIDQELGDPRTPR
jgi:prevent-host-death family protein